MSPQLSFGNKAIVEFTNRYDKEKKRSKKQRNILLLGPIGGWFGVGRNAVFRALSNSNELDELTVALATPGGDLFDALTIHNLIKSHPAATTCYLVGECASAGTIISSAFDRVVATKASTFMIHEVQAGATGNKRELISMAKDMETFDNQLIEIYKSRTGLRKDQLRKLLEEERFLSPDQAKDLGFVDEVVPSIELDYDAEFVGDNAGSLYFDQANPSQGAHNFQKHLQENGVLPFTNSAVQSIIYHNNRPMIKDFAAELVRAGVKLFKGDKELTQEEVVAMANEMPEMKDYNLTEAVKAALPQIVEDLKAVLPAAMQASIATDEAVLASLRESLGATIEPIVTNQVTNELEALRKEINALKTGASVQPSASANGQNTFDPPATHGSDRLAGAANKGNVSAYAQQLLDSGKITKAAFDAMTKPGENA